LRSRGADPRRAIAPAPGSTAPRHALPARQPRLRFRLLALLGALALVVGVAIVARPMVVAALTGTAAPTAAAAIVPGADVSPSPSAPPTTTPTAKSDCRGAKDVRETAADRKVPFTVCGVALISKNHRVTAAYAPKLVKVPVRAYGVAQVRLQPVAAKALVGFFTAARKDGYTLVVRSSWRSYATQAKWYATMSHALTAPAGASEHQSGLAVDLAGIERGRLVRGSALGSSRTGAWIVENAASHGFILRYPTSESKITGIAYEPWHFRYVGVSVAKGVDATKTKTLERYLGVK
jgi:D-alanyl-D-alanine carboxypeptidase